MGGGEREAHPADGLCDTGGKLDQTQPQGGELGLGQRLRPGNSVTQLQHEPVGGGMQDKADLIGER